MKDFKKLSYNREPKPDVDPMEIYRNLDRASDKGPLRPAQTSVLTDWYSTFLALMDTSQKGRDHWRRVVNRHCSSNSHSWGLATFH
ncbi:MAG: hypothetical protein CMN76_13530 [Spirochaetaceae bacterium]|nr:hypothetical protein [Spirochaetaceae bacterium]